MSQLHYCSNGIPVTDQVIKYQRTRDNDDFVLIQQYYNSYQEIWYRQLSEYIDRESFESEFDYKLIRAVDTFDEAEARSLSKKFNWPLLGMFNRWFYRILSNWKSNVKTSSFRIKKRPPVLCPVCGRWVGRIDAEHLQHYKTIKDLPRFVVFQNHIYTVMAHPANRVVCYGENDRKKLSLLNQGDTTTFASEKKTKSWPWIMSDGKSGVFCPLTKKIVPNLTDEYIQQLSDRVNRYADPISWEVFIETYPNALIQAEIYSLDASTGEDDDTCLRDQVSEDHRGVNFQFDLDLKHIRSNNVSAKYENSFYFIDQNVEDVIDREILKLFAIGYTMDDIASMLEIGKSEIKQRIKGVRSIAKDLEKCLMESIG